MEENTAELFDYLRVIWKRKILIIVVTLVCMGVGVGVKARKFWTKLPPATSYHTTVVVKVGQKLQLTFSNAVLLPVELPGSLVETIVIRFGDKAKEAGYLFEVKRLGEINMLKLIMKGPDSGVEKVLKEIVDKLIEEHSIMQKNSAIPYVNYIKKLEADAKMIQENIAIIESTIITMKSKEKQSMEYMKSKEGYGDKPDKFSEDRSVIWNMLYLKTIDKEIDLSRSRQNLRDIQWQLLVHRTTIGGIEDSSTKIYGKMKTTVVKPKEKSTANIFILAVIAGLIISIFIAFFIEYIEESKLKEKRK